MIFLLIEQSRAISQAFSQMNQSNFQQAWGYYSTPRNNQQSYLVTQHGDDSKCLSRSLTSWSNYGWKERCSQIGVSVLSQAVPLYNSQPHSTFTSFVQSPGVNVSLSVVDAECQFPANNQRNLLFWPDFGSTVQPSSVLLPYNGINHKSFTAHAALPQSHLEEPHSNSRQESGRCIRCWTLRKPICLLI